MVTRKKLVNFSLEELEESPKEEDVFNSPETENVDESLYKEAMEAIDMLTETKERLESLNEEQKKNLQSLEEGESLPGSTLDIRPTDDDEDISNELENQMVTESFRLENIAGKLKLPSAESLIENFTTKDFKYGKKLLETSKETFIMSGREKKEEFVKLYKSSTESIGEVIVNIAKMTWEAIKKFFSSILDFTKKLFSRYNIYQKQTVQLEKEFRDHIRKVKPPKEKSKFWEEISKDYRTGRDYSLKDKPGYNMLNYLSSFVYLDIENIRDLGENMEKTYISSKVYLSEFEESEVSQMYNSFIFRPIDPNEDFRTYFNKIKFTVLEDILGDNSEFRKKNIAHYYVAWIPKSPSNLGLVLVPVEKGTYYEKIGTFQNTFLIGETNKEGNEIMTYAGTTVGPSLVEKITRATVYYLFENRDLLNTRMLEFFKETTKLYSIYSREQEINKTFLKNIDILKESITKDENDPSLTGFSNKKLIVEKKEKAVLSAIKNFGLIYKELCYVPVIYSKVLNNIFTIIKMTDLEGDEGVKSSLS